MNASHCLDIVQPNGQLTAGQPNGLGNHAGIGGASNTAAYMSGGGGSTGNADISQFSHLPPLERKIVEFILSQPPSDEGVHAAAIARFVKVDADRIECVTTTIASVSSA